MTDTDTDTTSTTETDEWQLPLDAIMEAHKQRIAGNEEHVPAMLEAWVEGEGSIWTVWIGDTGNSNPRDCGLYAARLMASLTNCDYLLFSFDTHMSQHQINPTTGKPWEPGEMQRMCDEEGYCDTGNIRDNLAVAIVRRSDAKIHFASIPYHFHKGEVMYFDPGPPVSEWTDENAGVMQGRIPDGLREAMTEEPITNTLTKMGAYDALGFTEEEAGLARIHQILAGIRIMGIVGKNTGADGPMFISAVPTTTEAERNALLASAEDSDIEVRPVDDFTKDDGDAETTEGA